MNQQFPKNFELDSTDCKNLIRTSAYMKMDLLAYYNKPYNF